MKKTPLLLTLAVLILTVGGYYLYERILTKQPVRPWDLVPSETIFVYESDICESCIDELQKSTLWQIVSRASFYSKPADSLQARLKSILDRGRGLLVSGHIIRKDDFDFIYYLNGVSNLAEPLSQLPRLKGYRYSERQLNDIRIHELTRDRHTFSWIIIDNVWAGSFTPFLIEDVIRTHKGKRSFVAANADISKLPRISGDAGNLYLQLKQFPEWLSAFAPLRSKPYALGKSALLDIKRIDDNLVLNGFSVDSLNYSNYLLSVFRHQTPVAFGLRNFVPNRTISFTSFGINDGVAFAGTLDSFVKAHRPGLRDSLHRLSEGLGFQWKDLYALLGNEIGIGQLEGVESPRPTSVVIMETTSSDLWVTGLEALSEKFSEDTVFYERFSDYVIREIPLRRFPEKLLWPLVQGFEHTFYTVHDDKVFMADNLEELKYFLEDIEHDNVWGKSVARNQFLESTLLESNISLFVNTPRLWNVLLPRLHPRWRAFIRENQALLQNVQMSAFQFSHLNNTYYTNVTIHESVGRQEVAFASSARRNIVHFSQPLQRLHAVKSHLSRADEILVQDSLNDLSLVSMEGKVLWKLPIGDQITGSIHQIDFFKNGKLQYIFATHDAIHVIDRLGNYVSPYPLHLPGKDIAHLSIVDYDRSKNYRFLIGEQDGKVWMFDKSGTNLEGWRPQDVGGPLMSPPMHHRIKGKDFILAIRKDGQVHLYNRRGEMMKNFPLDLQGTPMGDYFLEMGADLANTFFVVVTRDGYRVKFNTEGRLQSREALLRASATAQFGLKAENSGKSYLIWQHDSRQLTVTDATGKNLLVNDHITLRDWNIDYYLFSGGKSFISLTDRVQALSFVFDGTGGLVTSPPLESTAIELRMAGSDQSHAFFIHENALTIQPLNP